MNLYEVALIELDEDGSPVAPMLPEPLLVLARDHDELMLVLGQGTLSRVDTSRVKVVARPFTAAAPLS